MHKSATVFWTALFCMGFAASGAASPVGKAVRASSTVNSNGGNGSRVLGSSSSVYFMDRLKTNGSGIGQFEFIDGTKLALHRDQGRSRAALAHDPEKWTPVFREDHAQPRKERTACCA